MSDQRALVWPPLATQEDLASPGANEYVLRLIARCHSGEEAAFTALYELFAPAIYRLNYSLLQHQQDAEEVLQDCFEYAFRRLQRYDPGRSAFKTWLYQIAISRCRNKRRRKRLPSFSLSLLPGQDLGDGDAPAPDDVVSLNEQQTLVWGALARLSTKLRETVVLRYYEGLSYKEIGRILQIPAKTAESRMRLAHKALRELLEDEFAG